MRGFERVFPGQKQARLVNVTNAFPFVTTARVWRLASFWYQMRRGKDLAFCFYFVLVGYCECHTTNALEYRQP